MTTLAVAGLTFLASYLIGAIPFGYLVARGRGVDIFQQGSGNIGATNVGRVLGRRFGIMVFLLDFAKGVLPAATAGWMSEPLAFDLPPDALRVGAGLAAFLGHLFPVYLRFRGGKGVATGAGVVAVLLPGAALAALFTWVMVLCATRYVSLASLAAVTALAAIRLGLTSEPFSADHRILSTFCLLAAGLVVLRHRANIVRLLYGTENRIPDTPAMLTVTKTIHVLALGLWFGSAVFFSFVVAPVIFQTFEAIGSASSAERPGWLPLSEDFGKEKATRLAGAAVAPVFPWYFLVQGVCALLATATALAWSRAEPRATIHKARFIILVLALATVLAGWPLAQKVSRLRVARYATDPVVADAAKAAFGSWHAYSLLLNFGTLTLVTAAMALAAQLPVASGQWPVTRKQADNSAEPPLDSFPLH